MKDPKARKMKDYEDPEFIRIKNEFKSHIIDEEEDGDDYNMANVSFAVLGIRNLMRAYDLPAVTCKLTTGKEEHKL